MVESVCVMYMCIGSNNIHTLCMLCISHKNTIIFFFIFGHTV